MDHFDLLILEKSSDLPISKIRITDIGKSFKFSDSGKSADLPISKIWITNNGIPTKFYHIGKSFRSTDIGESTIFLYRKMSYHIGKSKWFTDIEKRLTDIGNSIYQY